MTVYVDTQRNRFGRRIMAHMIADTPEELHAMAADIGIHRRWYQSTSFPHYDISLSKKKAAMALGAVELNRRAFVSAMVRICDDIRADPTSWR